MGRNAICIRYLFDKTSVKCKFLIFQRFLWTFIQKLTALQQHHLINVCIKHYKRQTTPKLDEEIDREVPTILITKIMFDVF